MAQSLLFAGAATAAVSLATAAWLSRPASTPFDDAAVRAAISRAPAAELYRAWTSMKASGVSRPETPYEERATRIARNRAAIAGGMGLVAGVGGLVASAAAIVILRRRAASKSPKAT